MERQPRFEAGEAEEREAALNRTYGAWSVAFALMGVMLVVYFLSTVVSRAVQPLIQGSGQPAAAYRGTKPCSTRRKASLRSAPFCRAPRSAGR